MRTSFSFLVAFVALVAPLAHAQSFAPPVHYKFGTMPDDLVSGDFNGDGKIDLATANSAANNVSVLLGKGNGTFAAKKNYSVGKKPHSMAVGDFNGDGKSDLVAANSEASNVSILLGKGNGTFGAKRDFKVGQHPSEYTEGAVPYSVAVGDFNGDGKSDLATANFFGDTVSVLMGKGDGTFAAPMDYDGGKRSIRVAVGDLNGDGKTDLVTVNHDDDGDSDSESQCFNVLLGQGDGTFAVKKNYKAGEQPQGVVVSDFNSDGKSDLAAVNSYSGGSGFGVSVLIGNGDGTFAARKNYKTGEQPEGLAVGDLNGDGKTDLITGNRGGRNLSVLLGKGDGTFAAKKDFTWDKNPEIIAVGDFNGDGKNDLAVTTEESVTVLINRG